MAGRGRKRCTADRLADPVLVWVAYQLAGAPAAVDRFGVSRRTVYRYLDAVEADAGKLAEARRLLEERRGTAVAAVDELQRATVEALTARVRSGRATTRALVALYLGNRAPRGGDGPAPPAGAVLDVPRFLTTPRAGT